MKKPQAKVSVNVDFGRGIMRSDRDDKISELIVEAALGDVVDDATNSGRDYSISAVVNKIKLEKTLKTTLATEYARGVKYAAQNLIGLSSYQKVERSRFLTFPKMDAGAFGMVNTSGKRDRDIISPPPGRVSWPALSKQTTDRKGHRRFFEDTGRLKTFLRNNARAIVRRTGIVKVLVSKQPRDRNGRFLSTKRSIPIANVQIRLMPNIPRSMLPGLRSGDFGLVDKNQEFEATIISDTTIQEKLMGPLERPDKQRPLLQPVFNYWSNYFIPARVAMALRRGRL